MASEMTLYWIPLSPPSMRVQLCLEEKKLQGYTSKILSYEKREHKSEEVLKINPRGEVPTFRHGDIFINESLAVCLYLEDQFKEQGTRLLPSDPALKAATLQRTFETENIYKIVLEEYMSYFWMKKPEINDKEFIGKKADAARAEISRWDKYMEQMGPGSYLVGKDFTLADVSFIPYLTFMISIKLSLANYPHLKSYYELVSQRSSFHKTSPEHIEALKDKDFLKDL